MSFPICSFIGSSFYHFVLILFGTSLFGPSLYCPLSFSYSTTWSYKLFVLALFWTSYFGPFSFCRLLFCPLMLCPVCFLAFHYLVLRKCVLFHFVTMWKPHVHLMLMTHGCYSILIWGNTCKSYLDKPVKLQKWAIRMIPNSHYRCHIAPSLILLKVIYLLSKIYIIYTLELGVFMFISTICDLPAAFKDCHQTLWYP